MNLASVRQPWVLGCEGTRGRSKSFAPAHPVSPQISDLWQTPGPRPARCCVRCSTTCVPKPFDFADEGTDSAARVSVAQNSHSQKSVPLFFPPGLLASSAIPTCPCSACLYFESSTRVSEACEGLIPASGFGGRVITQAMGPWGREEVSDPGCAVLCRPSVCAVGREVPAGSSTYLLGELQQ